VLPKEIGAEPEEPRFITNHSGRVHPRFSDLKQIARTTVDVTRKDDARAIGLIASSRTMPGDVNHIVIFPS
jgi:hypothetical protein